ncbi:MAG TPA: LPS export ABC transporter periplasmic protein LptC [Micropepsaceae bacterium]|nr:LPS export ABC transporter periplasmic protein LptC [Micropepsaceae bacterium]
MPPVQTEPAKPRKEMRLSYRAREWRISPRAALMSARRYSIFVKFMKGALPLAALALGAWVLVYALQPRDAGRMALTFERLGRVEGDLAMLKPRLTGVDNDGLPFVVTASRAIQESRGSDRVRLEDVTADMSLKDGTALHVTAVKGVVDTKTHVLEVSGGMHLISKDGYDARTQSAVADLRAGTVHGEHGIEAEGSFGRITAERFALNRDTRQLRFLGNVHMVLNGNKTTPTRGTLQ